MRGKTYILAHLVSGNKTYIYIYVPHISIYVTLFLFLSGKCAENLYNSSGIWTSPFLAMRKTLIYIYLCVCIAECLVTIQIYACIYICIYIWTHACTSLYASSSHWAIRSCYPKVLNFYTFPLSEQSEPSKRKTVYIRGYCSYDDKTRFRSVQSRYPFRGQLIEVLMQYVTRVVRLWGNWKDSFETIWVPSSELGTLSEIWESSTNWQPSNKWDMLIEGLSKFENFYKLKNLFYK